MKRLISMGAALVSILAGMSLGACARPPAPGDGIVDNPRFNIPAAHPPYAAVNDGTPDAYPDVEKNFRDPFVETEPVATEPPKNPPVPGPVPGPGPGPGPHGKQPPQLPPRDPSGSVFGLITGSRSLFFYGKSMYAEGDVFMKDWVVNRITEEKATLRCIREGFTSMTAVMNFARDVVNPVINR